jgi:hypothetical protein
MRSAIMRNAGRILFPVLRSRMSSKAFAQHPRALGQEPHEKYEEPLEKMF